MVYFQRNTSRQLISRTRRTVMIENQHANNLFIIRDVRRTRVLQEKIDVFISTLYSRKHIDALRETVIIPKVLRNRSRCDAIVRA